MKRTSPSTKAAGMEEMTKSHFLKGRDKGLIRTTVAQLSSKQM